MGSIRECWTDQKPKETAQTAQAKFKLRWVELPVVDVHPEFSFMDLE